MQTQCHVVFFIIFSTETSLNIHQNASEKGPYTGMKYYDYENGKYNIHYRLRQGGSILILLIIQLLQPTVTHPHLSHLQP